MQSDRQLAQTMTWPDRLSLRGDPKQATEVANPRRDAIIVPTPNRCEGGPIMAKGQMRTTKEKKKPKADKSKVKQLSPYKLSQLQAQPGASAFTPPPKKA
jgi:hypothetical protein